jgi:transcriptional regulator with XRE-family HTH domain
MTNREKFLTLVSEADTQAEMENDWRIANRFWLRASQRIAFNVLERLDSLGWTQKDLADKMGVSPQYIHKIVKGGENLTLETQVKLQEILDIPILASYFKAKTLKQRSKSFFFETGMTQERLSVSSAPRVRRKVLEIKTKNAPFKVLEMNCFSTNYPEIA